MLNEEFESLIKEIFEKTGYKPQQTKSEQGTESAHYAHGVYAATPDMFVAISTQVSKESFIKFLCAFRGFGLPPMSKFNLKSTNVAFKVGLRRNSNTAYARDQCKDDPNLNAWLFNFESHCASFGNDPLLLEYDMLTKNGNTINIRYDNVYEDKVLSVATTDCNGFVVQSQQLEDQANVVDLLARTIDKLKHELKLATDAYRIASNKQTVIKVINPTN